MPPLKPTTYFDIAKPLPVIEKLTYIYACHVLYKTPWADTLASLSKKAAQWADPTGLSITPACTHACLKELVKKELLKKEGETFLLVPLHEIDLSKLNTSTADVGIIFEHWKKITNHPQARLDAKRRKRIKAAVHLGYSQSELCNVITGCAMNPWNNGDNPQRREYNSIDLIFRDADKIDQFLKIFQEGAKTTGKAAQRESRNSNAISSWLDEDDKNE